MQVLAHTKAELSKAGVNVAALDAAAEASGSAATSKSVARSTTVLLVKNLPYSCTEDEIHDLFAKFGVVLVVLPSTRALALVELTDKQVCSSCKFLLLVPQTLSLFDRDCPQQSRRDPFHQTSLRIFGENWLADIAKLAFCAQAFCLLL
jgi:RNA recognition motif-containing protein